MIEWFYLSFGFALFFNLLRGSNEVQGGEILTHAFYLTGALGILILLDAQFSLSLWEPIGRSDFRFISIFLWALLIDEGLGRLRKRTREKTEIRLVGTPTFLALVGFSGWTLGREGPVLFWGLGLPAASGVFEWLLGGLKRRVRLSNLPQAFGGEPILFWLATLLFLAFGVLGKIFPAG